MRILSIEVDPKVARNNCAIFIGGGVLCILLVLLIISMFVGIFKIQIPAEDDYTTAIAVFLGALIWIIIFASKIAPKLIVDVPDNESWIMAHGWRQETVQVGGSIPRQRTIKAQRSIPSGPNMIDLLEYKAGVVDMTKRALTTKDDPNSYKTSDGFQVNLRYKLFCATIPGHEVNKFRFSQPNSSGGESVDENLEGIFQAWLEGYCCALPMDSLTGKLDDINKAIKEQFLPNQGLTDKEKEMGTQITDVTVFRVTETDAEKAVDEDTRKVRAMIKAAAELEKLGFSKQDAFDRAVAVSQGTGVTVRDERFGLNVTGAKGLQSVYIGGSSSGNQPNQGKNKQNKGGGKGGQGQNNPKPQPKPPTP